MLVVGLLSSSQDVMARWGEDKTLYFIFLYRNHECLWNAHSPFYRNKASREAAYQSILDSFNDKSMTVDSVKIKIKNLRSIYHTQLRKVEESKRTGNEGEIYRPILSWYDEMHSFLGPLTVDENLEYREMVTRAMENRDLLAVQKTEIKSDSEVEHFTYEPELQTDGDIKQEDPIATSPSTSMSGQRRSARKSIRKKKSLDDKALINAYNRLDAMSSATTPLPLVPKEDEFHYFALSVAAQLRELPLDSAIDTLSKIQSTLSAARLSSMQVYSNPSTP